MDLKQFRKTYNLGQSDLAELFGCKQANISNIENGVRNLTQPQLMMLIDKYGIESVKPFISDSDLLPASVNIDMRRTKIEGNTAPVQNGDGNQMTNNDASLIQVLSQQSAQITELLKQQDRLISLLEKK